LLVFTDANVELERDALERLAEAFADPTVGYACGQVVFRQAGEGAGADNQEGLYWRYEMGVRGLESRLASVTAGNGGLQAVRREAYVEIDPRMDHDIYLPFHMVKRGLRAVYVPAARGSEKMVPSIEGEFARKRRFMSHVWITVLRGGMLSPRGYGPLYALMILSHRVLRYSAPVLHAVALIANGFLLGQGVVYVVTFCLQVALLLAALVGRNRLFLVARYYVAMNASIALGLWDYLTRPTVTYWEAAEGTR
jgi:cellulose synthase/poly-beta-1,6-N-acetylglucosamine synthase-like glycosyltransferase